MRLPLIAIVVLFTSDAYATDYLKCEAIERAYAKIERERDEVVNAAVTEIEVRNTNPSICGQKPMLQNTFTLNILDARPSPELVAYLDCEKKQNAPLIAEAVKRISQPYNKKLAKIDSDFKKQGCP